MTTHTEAWADIEGSSSQEHFVDGERGEASRRESVDIAGIKKTVEYEFRTEEV